MAYVIFTANGSEIDRRDLAAPVTVGRAQEADIPVRDILLSRRHCRLEPSADGQWVVVDLGSKNGTYLGNRQVTRHALKDGDELRIGRTRMTFRAGAFEPAPPGTRRREVVRPADPTEAMAGTVAGFLLVEPGEVERQAGAPVPQPRPPEPSSYASEDVYGMLNELASSSWDSIQAQASRPLVMERPLPRPSGYRVEAPRRTRVAFSLQAPESDAEQSIQLTASDAERSTQAPPGPPQPRRRRSWKPAPRFCRQATLAVVSAVATALLVGAWVIAVNQGPRAGIAKPSPRARAVGGGTFRSTVNDLTFPPLPRLTLPTPPTPVPAHTAPPAEPSGHSTAAAAVPPAAYPSTFRDVARVAALHLLIVP